MVHATKQGPAVAVDAACKYWHYVHHLAIGVAYARSVEILRDRDKGLFSRPPAASFSRYLCRTSGTVRYRNAGDDRGRSPANSCETGSGMGNTEPKSLETNLGNAGFPSDSAIGVSDQVRPPRVVTVDPLNDHRLRILFDNGVVKHYNVKPLLTTPLFKPLQDLTTFRSVHVEPGGFAVAWDSGIDVSEYELWQHGS